MHIEVNGTRLFVDCAGSALRIDGDRLASNPTLVALHGGPGFDQGYLRPGLAALARTQQVLYVDLRGQGRSRPEPAADCTLERMADDVAALCSVLGVTSPVVFGHSAGGFVALHLALRHPQLAAGLVLCDTAATLAPDPDGPVDTADQDHVADPPGLVDRGTPHALEVAGRLFGGDFSAETFAEFNRVVLPLYAAPGHADVPGREMALSGFQADIAGHFFGVLAAGYDLRPHLAEVTAPALVVVGSEDWVMPPSASRTLARGIPQACLAVIEGSGHFPFSEEPDAFLRTVDEFLRQIRPDAEHAPV